MTTPSLTPDENDGAEDAAIYTFPTATPGTGAPDATPQTSTTDTDSADNASDGEPAVGPVLVDQGADTGPGRLEARLAARRMPVRADWASSGENLKRSAGFLFRHGWHVTKFHGVRLPWYGLKATALAPRGAAVSAARLSGWITDAEGQAVRADAVRRNHAEDYLKLSRQRDARVKSRAIVAGTGAAVVLICAAALSVAGPMWQGAGVVVAVLALGWAGAPKDNPLIGPAVLIPAYTRLTSDVVLRALGALGIPALTQAVAKGGRGLAFVAPIREDGPGWRAEVDLPWGVTAVDVMEKRRELASGLRRPLGCVWPEPVHEEHSGRLVLWVGKHEMRNAPQPAWPLERKGAANVFAPAPLGTDPRGKTVSVTIFENNFLIGAAPGQGKSFTLLPLLYTCCLDPATQVWLFNFKGDAFYNDVETVVHRYVTGIDDDAILAGLNALKALKAEILRRVKIFNAIGDRLGTDKKLTREVALDPKLDVPVITAFFDEVQNLFAHPKYGDEAGKLAEFIIKIGRSLGIVLVLATQRPDKDSIPTGVSGNVTVRICLRVIGQMENDMILGTSAYKKGIRATEFTTLDKGIALVVGAHEEPVIERSFYPINGRAVADRARDIRTKAGRLTGDAAGIAVPVATDAAPTVLDDLAAVFDSIAFVNDKVWGAELLALLTAHRAETYRLWKVKTLTEALKPFGVKPVGAGRQVNGKYVNNNGYTREALAAALTQRDENRGA